MVNIYLMCPVLVVFLSILGGGVHSEYVTHDVSNSGGVFIHFGGRVHNEYVTFDVSNSGNIFIHFRGWGS
jgi:hypothetical protein